MVALIGPRALRCLRVLRYIPLDYTTHYYTATSMCLQCMRADLYINIPPQRLAGARPALQHGPTAAQPPAPSAAAPSAARAQRCRRPALPVPSAAGAQHCPCTCPKSAGALPAPAHKRPLPPPCRTRPWRQAAAARGLRGGCACPAAHAPNPKEGPRSQCNASAPRPPRGNRFPLPNGPCWSDCVTGIVPGSLHLLLAGPGVPGSVYYYE
jgi:hypothetical protein